MSKSETDASLEAYIDAGRRVAVDGVATHVTEEGEGEPVLCVHGVPVSGFLWRKVLPGLAERGLRGIAFDLPGLGLADRPDAFDYSWTGLGQFTVGLVDVLGLERFHLVVHDIGGPVGFELAAAMPDRIRSLTVLNTLINVASFRKPWSMRPFEFRGLGPLMLKTMFPTPYAALMYSQGISDKQLAPRHEVLVHRRLLLRDDGGRAFLRIMRSFETTEAKEALYRAVVSEERYPRQAIWGERDPALRVDTFGAVARALVGEARFSTVPGKHFLQETAYDAIAERVAALAAEGRSPPQSP